MSSVIVVSSLGQVFLAITQPYTGNRDGRSYTTLRDTTLFLFFFLFCENSTWYFVESKASCLAYFGLRTWTIARMSGDNSKTV